jgi:hypothetical protein
MQVSLKDRLALPNSWYPKDKAVPGIEKKV